MFGLSTTLPFASFTDDNSSMNDNSPIKESFEKKFGMPFDKVINTNQFSGEFFDDGIFHYVDVQKNVYSYESFEEKWFKKNKYQTEVLNNVELPEQIIIN